MGLERLDEDPSGSRAEALAEEAAFAAAAEAHAAVGAGAYSSGLQ